MAGADAGTTSAAAGHENSMTQLTTQMQAVIAILVVLLGSQAALWIKLGEISGQLVHLAHHP